MNTIDFEKIEPKADSVIQSLRSIGYDLQSSIADIIDNSITARATKIEIVFHWNEQEAFIRIADNGTGMTEEELINAMRLGSKSPLFSRDEKDLGRFGMGLKTASFSQCRRLSVLTKKNNKVNFRCWDLDVIKKTNEWALLKQPTEETTQLYLGQNLSALNSGTVVLWEKLDRVLPSETYSPKSYDKFLKLIDQLEHHLSLVFHRFLSGPKVLEITINGIPIKPWDPFLTNESATQELPVDTFIDGEYSITVHPFILPHKSKISEETYLNAGGLRGWNDMQGFYIYRNKRLLLAGNWLGFFSKEEPYKLARVMIDINSELDFKWQIDIKKSKARPPTELVDPLKNIAKAVRAKSYQIYYHRGVMINKRPQVNSKHLWEQVMRRGAVIYKVNQDHPLLQNILEDNPSIKKILITYLTMLEESVPANQIAYNASETESSEVEEIYTAPERDLVQSLMNDIVYALRISGVSNQDILHYLNSTQPFKSFPKLIESFLNIDERRDFNANF